MSPAVATGLRTAPTRTAWLACVALGGACGCAGPPEPAAERGSLADLAALLAGPGATKVEGVVGEGDAADLPPITIAGEEPESPATAQQALDAGTQEPAAEGGPPQAGSEEAGVPTSAQEPAPTPAPAGPAQEPALAEPQAVPPAEGSDETTGDPAAAPQAEPSPDLLGEAPDEPAGAGAAQDVKPDELSYNPYLVHGERIQVHPDGRITKPFPLTPNRGRKVLQEMILFADFPIKWDIYGANEPDVRPPKHEEVLPDEVEVILLEGADLEYFDDLRAYPPIKPPLAVPVADRLMVTAMPALLREVEDWMNTFVASIPQIEIEAKIVELSETDELDIGLRSPVGAPVFDFPEGVFVDAFDYDLPNAETMNEAVLALGAVQDETIFNLVLEAIARWENVAIMSQPKIVVREGVRADIVNIDEVPFYSFTNLQNDNPTVALTFKPVGIQLYVIPRVLGTDTVSLHIDIEASTQTSTAATVAFQGGLLSTPVISKRSARTVVHLEPGQAVILGGLTTERTRDAENKVPLLGDIPLLGYLFKSKFQRKERVHVLFFIRPRILQGAEFQQSDAFTTDW